MHAARRKRLHEARSQGRPDAATFSYEAAIAFLDARGLPGGQTREGSMPVTSLELVAEQIDRLDASSPLVALHIGNFVGVSLAYLAWVLTSVRAGSRVLSIDPNIPHRGITRPAETVVALLTHFGLESSVGVLHGYSLTKNPSNDGVSFGSYDPVANWGAEQACTDQLGLLRIMAPGRFDVCLIDGNHEGGYLARELEAVADLLRPDGLLVLDDVGKAWPEIQSVYAAAAPDQFAKVAADGRVGLLRRV
jgi:predicted O-methyltransferase YrrM